MKLTSLCAVAALFIAGALAGCTPDESADNAPAPTAPAMKVSTAQPLGTLKVGGRAVCAVCAAKEGTSAPEEVKAVIDYKGKSYGFCNEDEKAEFISDPAKYAP